jgi:hypothetical protein
MRQGFQFRRGAVIAVLIIVLVGGIAAAMSFFQGAGVNRDNPDRVEHESTYQR